MRHLAFVVALLWIGLPAVLARAQDDRAVVNAPTEGVLSDSVWYDADTGAVVPIHVTPVTDDSMNRNSRWLPQAKRVAKPAANPATGTGTTTGTGAGVFGTNLSFGNLLGWFLLIVMVAAAIGLLLYTVSKTELDLTSAKGGKSADLLKATDEQILERIKHLPAELRRTDVNLRSEAERLMREGQFDQAIILLFGHQLLLLDRVGMLRLNRGKTNRRYVRETRRDDPAAAKILNTTVQAFERSYFGRHSITAPQFEQLWQSNESLERSIERRREVAA